MAEFVFLPDPKIGPTASIKSLTNAMSGVAKLSVSPSLPGAESPETQIGQALRSVDAFAEAAPEAAPDVEVIGLVQRSGALLLRSTSLSMAGEVQGGRVVPVVLYRPAIAEVRVGSSKMQLRSGPAATGFMTIKLRFRHTGAPCAGAVANLRRIGANEMSAVSDANGVVTFPLHTASVANARLMIEPGFAGHWGFFQNRVTLRNGDTIDIEPANLDGGPDALRRLIAPGGLEDGTGVRVGVIDSGVGPHVDLPNVVGDADTSIGHGTHVAGIIGGQGPGGFGGIAPGVEIISYRVFDDPETGVARNFEIHRAIEQAITDECLIVNLSLKSEIPFSPSRDDPVISRALEDAADAGVLCVAAAGNDFRRFVAFPARHPDAVAVSALGWEPGMPATAFDRWTTSNDRSKIDPDLFFATFSNEGVDNTRVDLAAPGAGIVSTVPGNTYAPMSGTSMACPAIVGAIARLVSRNPHILAMPPNRARVAAMHQLIQDNVRTSGFDAVKQGAGTLA